MDPTEDWSGEPGVSLNNDEIKETESERIIQVIPGYASFDEYVQEAFDVIRGGIKAANNLPNGENYNYYSCFPSFVNAKAKESDRLLSIMQDVLNVAGICNNISRRDIDDQFELVLETNDVFLDRANAYMDQESGVVKNAEVEIVVSQARKQTVNGSWNAQTHRLTETSENTQSVRLLAGKNIHRPQLSFKDKIDNSSKPWCPRIKDKPNSLRPLAIYLVESDVGEIFNHPYEVELDKFVPPDNQLKKCVPTKYKTLEDTPLIIIEKPGDIKILLEDLQKYKEIAIDLEHHSYRTFQGITCLMQISTADTDYLIDTLTLRSELHELNEIFTKPTILKVFHGADLDIQWLQRDLSLYVVNMFDTHQAAKQLNLPYLSLAYLLKRYCNIDPNKHFQLADWRIRPLPEELKKYAREDTHYLLHIKDILRNALIDTANGQTNILKAVYDRSRDICKKTYVKPVWTEESYMNMYRKSQKMFNNKQLYALRELHKWRDLTARAEDDSTGYVLPNHMLLNITETLPREMQGILACCNPIPPLVRQNLLTLHKVILKAREQPLIKPVLEEDLRQRLVQRNQITNSEAWMYSPHDIPNGMEARADLPCLLDKDTSLEVPPLNDLVEHVVTVFDTPVTFEVRTRNGRLDEEIRQDQQSSIQKKKFVFISPFERYKRVIPMVAEQEAQERERQRKEDEESLNKMQKGEEEILDSKNRVYEHFKKVSQNTHEEVPTPQLKKTIQIPLSQMQGKKRKRKSKINQQNVKREKPSDDLLTPAPSLDVRIAQGIKREAEKAADLKQERQIQESLARIQERAQNNDTIKPMRQRTKAERKANRKELVKKGMLPVENFNYKSVDFSAFQGGSTKKPHEVKFEQKTKKKKDRHRNRKKQKLNI